MCSITKKEKKYPIIVQQWEFKMKKIIIATIIGVLIISLLIAEISSLRLNEEWQVQLHFHHLETSIDVILSADESKSIIQSFNHKRLKGNSIIGELSCGFSSEVSLEINGEYYEMACDKCPYVFVKSKNRYIVLRDRENIAIREIFENHGCYFPCV